MEYMHVCVYVCVHVRVYTRARERERKRERSVCERGKGEVIADGLARGLVIGGFAHWRIMTETTGAN